jgi:hypothetical protein
MLRKRDRPRGNAPLRRAEGTEVVLRVAGGI